MISRSMSSGGTSAGDAAKYDADGDGKPDDKAPPAPPPTLLVWAARLFSLAAITGIVGYLLYLCFVRPAVPAQFDFVLGFDAVEERDGSWVLPVEVVNDSTNAVSSLVVEVTQGDATRSTTFSLMGEGETAELEVRFPERPTASNTSAEVVSYQSP